ncbi:MAG: hypothetical protein H7Y33_09355 [Cytophagales bacterium]|nr:hypothetical protein [Rhizobacter sp.]
MVRTCRQRRWLSGWLILALLFMQLATAAYACPAQVTAERTVAATPAMPEMPGCDMAQPMDPDQPQLCQAHCQQGNQAVNPPQAGDAASPPVLLAVLDWARAALAVPQPKGMEHGVDAGAAPPGSPPLYIVLLVLRN